MPSLKQEGRYVGFTGVYPLVLYAQKIGKNTAELTAADMSKFTKEWMKEPVREDIINVTPEQRVGYNKDVAAMKQWREEGNMPKGYTTKKYQDAQTSRLAEQGIESPINDGEEEIVIHDENEIVCSMELTRKDVNALLWGIKQLFSDYELGDIGISLSQLKEGLEVV